MNMALPHSITIYNIVLHVSVHNFTQLKKHLKITIMFSNCLQTLRNKMVSMPATSLFHLIHWIEYVDVKGEHVELSRHHMR
jgi:hypothetical protein